MKTPLKKSTGNALFMKVIWVFVAAGLSGCLGSSSSTNFAKTGTGPRVQLNWAASGGDATQGYSIEESSDDVSFSQVQTVGNVTTATVTVPSYGATFYFRVRAYNQGGYSSYSPIASVVAIAPAS
jgi:hypothetical protein